LTDSAANLLGQKDPAKVEQLQGTFNSVLTQTNALQAQLAAQGASVQTAFADTLGKIYENTLESAKKVANELDANRPQ
jgi:ABC-type transporter Mla subunit MlaD